VRRLLVICLLPLALAIAPTALASEQHPTLGELEGEVMCPTCHTTLDQSDAPAAQRIKAYIQRRIDECATAQQIESELVVNFGAGILAAPTHKGLDLLAWWLPLGGVILGAGLLGLGVWRWSRGREPVAPPAGGPALNGKPAAELDPETERRLDELLAKLE